MPHPDESRADEGGRPRRELAAVALVALGLAVTTPTPLRAQARGARAPGASTPVERALTGGLATLRAPGSSMIRIAASRFVMGSDVDEIFAEVGRCAREPLGNRCTESTFSNELPKIEAFARSFWLDRTEVTVEAYERCVALGVCAARTLVGGETRLAGATLPVTLVSAHEAETYCRFRGGRLPSEAEFERAARGTAGRRYPWGELYNSRLANHGRFDLDRVDASDGYEELAPVGSFVAGRTPDGLLDLAGNAAEWTQDVYADRHGLEPEPGRTGDRVVKGGSFARGAAWLRGAAREAFDANERSPFVGFRCARSADAVPPERP